MTELFSRIEAIIFDFDDTLVPSSAIYAQTYSKLRLDQEPGFAAARQRVKRRLGGESPAAHQRLLYFKAWQEHRAPALGRRLSPESLLRLQARYESLVQQAIYRYWRAGQRAAWLAHLRRYAQLAICTNETTRMQLIKWQAVNTPRGWCDAFVTSEEMGREKPSLALFEEVASRLKVPLSRCLMVGDDLRRDIAPAQSLGMRAIWTTEFLTPLQRKQQAERHIALLPSTPHVRGLEAICFKGGARCST